ncbi:hypothetical protein C0Q70_12693 [Pomacea canaliculata]|uniref:Uncharacterized protein n=1 Tax=Pomacea canaliculata TaxID=400727 RepID=A0A2T7P287_POMCA|nr:hypothetical protein C0Q70_12693 [Pomacea canaliculata]
MSVLSRQQTPYSSSPALIGPIVGGIVAAVVIVIIACLLAIFIRRQRRHLKMIEEPPHLTPPTDNHGYEDVHIRSSNEETATTQLREADMYENTQRLADQTYDTPGRDMMNISTQIFRHVEHHQASIIDVSV